MEPWVVATSLIFVYLLATIVNRRPGQQDG